MAEVESTGEMGEDKRRARKGEKGVFDISSTYLVSIVN